MFSVSHVGRESDSLHTPFGGIPTTHWSRLTFEAGSEAGRVEAYAYFYERYRGVVYRFFRRSGFTQHEAAEAAQDFFLKTLATPFLDRADPERGRFRGYLKKALKGFLIDAWRGRRRRKPPLSLEGLSRTQGWSAYEPVSEAPSPEVELDREWARGVVARAEAEVRRWYESKGRSEYFVAFLRRTYDRASSEEISSVVGIPAERIDSICNRARNRLAKAIRREVMETIEDPRDLDDEIADLSRLLGEQLQ